MDELKWQKVLDGGRVITVVPEMEGWMVTAFPSVHGPVFGWDLSFCIAEAVDVDIAHEPMPDWVEGWAREIVMDAWARGYVADRPDIGSVPVSREASEPIH